MKVIILLWVSLPVMVISLLVTPLFVHVQAQEVGISQSPSVIELETPPDNTITAKFVVGNVGDARALTTSIVNIKPVDELGHITLDENLSGPLRFTLKNKNLELEKPYLLNEDAGQELVLEIRVPENTPDGDYYYALTTTHETGRIPAGTKSISHKLHVSSIILVTVSPDGFLEQKGVIGEFRIDSSQKFFQTKEPVPFRLVVNNTGKNKIKPHGFLEIQGPGVNKHLPLLSENILAESSRQMSIQDGTSLKGFYVGRYVVQAYVDTGENIMRAQTSFVAIPTALLFWLIVVVALLITASATLRK